MASGAGGIVKLGVLGVGGYLLYKYFQGQSGTPAPGTPAATEQTAGVMTELQALLASLRQTSGGGITPGGTVPTPVAQQPAPVPVSGEPSVEMLALAASDPAKAYLAGSKKLNWHQWNYYREQSNPSLPRYAPEDVGMGDGLAPISIAQWYEAMRARGLAGYRRGAAVAFRGLGGIVPAGSPFLVGADYLRVQPFIPLRVVRS